MSASMPVQKPATPTSPPLIDNYQRRIDYVRLAVTELCNLRCIYCMPAGGIPKSHRDEMLSIDEMKRLIRLLAPLGIRKVRLTGGEPLVRKGLIDLLWHIRQTPGIEQIHLTTNGLVTAEFLPELHRIGINGINLSIDTLDRDRFRHITRRDGLERVMASFHAILAYNIPLKINMVVMNGVNTEDIIPVANLSKNYPVDVRFIEEMPFNGGAKPLTPWNRDRILNLLKTEYPSLKKVDDHPNSTAHNYKIEGHQGCVGIIAGFSRLFCGSCNRLRITAKGMLKTCLYDQGVYDLRQELRNGTDDAGIQHIIRRCVGQRNKDGFETVEKLKQNGTFQSMSAIGG